jgi:hypothetical protein
MSPEQARGQSVDRRSDLWSLGAVFYELLAGAPPFGGETPSDIIASILAREPSPLAEPGEPELQNILARALAKERERRYQSAPDMLRDIQELKRKLERRSEVETSIASRGLNRTAAIDAPGIESIAGKTRRKRSLAALAALLFILALSIILAAFDRSTGPLPYSFALESAPHERVIAYSIIVQKMRNGETFEKPFEASGHESFESGWKFRFRLVSPQAGYLYLLNEGPASGGDVNYRIIFPISSINHGSARVEANQQVQTGWYVFSERAGVEKLWVVWAALAVQPLEAIKDKVNPVDQGVVSDTTRRDSIREWLAMRAADMITTQRDEGARQTVVRGRGDVLASLIELTHRLPQSVGLYNPIRDAVSYYGFGRDGHETIQ